MQAVLLAEAAVQPWRNGGGLTRELLAWPPGPQWQLRISVAEISRDGPFSAFPGIARWFAVVQGAGVTLAFPSSLQRCVADGAVVAFDGAAAPGCTLTDGATQDLNLMVRSDAGSGAMQAVERDAEWLSLAPFRAMFSAGAADLFIDGACAAQLPAAALVFATRAAQQRWRLQPADGGTLAWWLSFQAHRP